MFVYIYIHITYINTIKQEIKNKTNKIEALLFSTPIMKLAYSHKNHVKSDVIYSSHKKHTHFL